MSRCSYQAALIALTLTTSSTVSAAEGGNESARILRRLADCVVVADRAGSIALINAYPHSDGERKQATALMSTKGQCGGAEGKVPIFYFRGAIAESLYRRKFTQAPEPGEVSVVMPSEADWENREPIVKQNRLAACMTSIDPRGVDALVRSAPGSEAEPDGFVPLQQTLDQCAEKIGAMEIRAENLRAALAESLYRLASIKANEPLQERPWPPVARN